MAQGSNLLSVQLETQTAGTLSYVVGDSDQSLVISPSVLNHFRKNQQKKGWFHKKEAGGQLFARLLSDQVVIEKATGPRKSDFRTRHTIRARCPGRAGERSTIRTGTGCTMLAIGIHIQKKYPGRRITT